MRLIRMLKRELSGDVESIIFLHSTIQGVEMLEFINSEELRLEHSVFYYEDLKNVNTVNDLSLLLERTEPTVYDEECCYVHIEEELKRVNEFNGIKLRDAVKVTSFEEEFIDFYKKNKKIISIISK